MFLLLALVLATANAGERQAEEISTSVGPSGGVIVLWPRVGRGRKALNRAAAWMVQRELSSIARELGVEVDVRPEPQRVCPRDGCAATRLGAAVLRARGVCAVVATIGTPGPSPDHLVPWVGDVRLAAPEVPFRVPPEGYIGVMDFVGCDMLAGPLREGRSAILRAAREVLGP